MHILPPPIHVVQGPGIYSLWWPLPMAQQELGQTISCPPLVSLGSFTCPYEISQRLVSGIWHPYRCQLSRAIAPGQLQSIAPVRLHALSRPHRYQCLALLLRTWRPAPSVASTTRSPSGRPHNRIAILQQDPVSLPIYERAHIDLVVLQSIAPLRLAPQRRPQSSLRGHPNRQTFILFTDRLLSLVALRFGLTDSQR